jgi:hypothetical protein
LGAVERRTALVVNHREIRNLEKLRRSGALQGAEAFPDEPRARTVGCKMTDSEAERQSTIWSKEQDLEAAY